MLTTLELYDIILEVNKLNGWQNPQFQPNTNPQYKDDFFCVKVDDFLEIEDNYKVIIFRVNKRWNEIIIYCRRGNFS